MLNVLKNSLGGSSLIDSAYDATKEETYEKIAKFGKMGLKPFFDLFVSSSPKDPKSYVLRVSSYSS